MSASATAGQAGQIRKKVKPGLIELDPKEPVIVVNIATFWLDQSQTTPEGQPKVVQQKTSQKR